MARQAVFSSDTKLWHAAEGWRVFPTGETDPGAAWHEKEGGAPVGAETTTSAMKDLIAAQDQIEALQGRLDSQAHDMALAQQAREKADGAVAGLEQRAIAAEKAQAEAEAQAAEYMRERDTARAQIEQSNAAVSAANERADATEAKVQGLVDQLGVANQQIADLTAPPAKPAK